MRRRRDATARPAWRMSDLFTALGLAAAIPPAWLLPEWSWAPILRMAARVPLFTNQRAIRARRCTSSSEADVSAVQLAHQRANCARWCTISPGDHGGDT